MLIGGHCELQCIALHYYHSAVHNIKECGDYCYYISDTALEHQETSFIQYVPSTAEYMEQPPPQYCSSVDR